MTLKTTYTQDQTDTFFTVLSQLPELVLSNYIGGIPSTLDEYITKCDLLISLYNSFGGISKPTYPTAGSPNQLYYLTKYGVYEVPFVWWFTCRWLNGFQMDTTPIDSCSWNQDGNGGKPTSFGPIDPRLSTLFGMGKQSTSTYKNITLLQQLISLPGIVTKNIIDQAVYIAEKSMGG